MRFRVFIKGKLANSFTLCGAYLFGTDGVSIRRTRIAFKDGFIECKKPNLETAGMALLWPVEGFGRVLLPTTCLPERKRPYNLNVEVTRAKLMQIINKREDWAFFDGIEGFEQISNEAQELFIRAIQHVSDPSTASQLADQALSKAMVLSERLATEQAAMLFDIRAKNHGFGRGCLGCRVNPKQINNSKYLESLFKLFGYVTIPVHWASIEPEKGKFDFSTLDACVEALSQRRVAIAAGPLLRFSKDFLPKWLLRSGVGFEKIRETAYYFVSNIVARYANNIRRWYVISSLNVDNQFGFSFEQILEMTRVANMAVRSASARALKIVEISNPWGEYYATTTGTIPPLVYVDMIVQSGINFDAFGLQMQFGKNQAGMHVRDMMQISAMLDFFGPIAKPLFITGVEIPGKNGEDAFDSKVAGVWHKKWDEQQQAQWIEQFYKIALSKPFVDAVTYGNLADTFNSTIAYSGLLTEQFQPKESYQTLKKLHESIFRR